ncbi:DUF202 domain-containing protein [bacterium]|nr:DUF202 domain-containing protein [bacterium]
MARGVYKKFQAQELRLRDHLALDRTVLANERTFLAYIRTALALVLTGASLIKFTDAEVINLIGRWFFIPMGAVTAVFGLIRYWKMKVSFPQKK